MTGEDEPAFDPSVVIEAISTFLLARRRACHAKTSPNSRAYHQRSRASAGTSRAFAVRKTTAAPLWTGNSVRTVTHTRAPHDRMERRTGCKDVPGCSIVESGQSRRRILS